MTIAVCSPELIGDVLWTVPAARELARRRDCLADYWLSHRAKNVVDLLAAQRFVRRVVVSSSWKMGVDCSTTEMVNGVQVYDPPGRPHVIREPESMGYETVHQLGFANTSEYGGLLLDYFCDLAGVGRQGHHFDIPDGAPSESYPDGPFVVMTNKGTGEMARTGWGKVLRDFVKHCPIPVVEAGQPGSALATDLGTLDRTRDGFLELAGLLSKCKYYVGNISAPLVIADAFPNVRRIALSEGLTDMRHVTTSGGMNFYLRASDCRELLNYIEEAR